MHPKVLCTPHLGASTVEAQKRVALEIAEQIADATKGKPMIGLVCSFHSSQVLINRKWKVSSCVTDVVWGWDSS